MSEAFERRSPFRRGPVSALSRIVGPFGRAAALTVACALTAACSSAPPPRAKQPSDEKPAPIAADIVERSALPLSVELGAQKGSIADLAPRLASVRAVCIGESHDNAHHHFAQRELTRALARETTGRSFAIGFEMFQRPFQPALDRYARDGNAEELLRASEFEKRWGHAFPYYAPLLEVGRSRGANLLALNASRELTKAVARGGSAALPEALASELPELNDKDPEHRAFFERAMGMRFDAKPGEHESAHGAHGGHAGFSLEYLYLAQLVWDETMAETAARWLEAHPEGLLVIIAGAGHCHESAIPRRIQRRGPFETVSGRALLRSELGTNDAPADSQFEMLLVLEDAQVALSSTAL